MYYLLAACISWRIPLQCVLVSHWAGVGKATAASALDHSTSPYKNTLRIFSLQTPEDSDCKLEHMVFLETTFALSATSYASHWHDTGTGQSDVYCWKVIRSVTLATSSPPAPLNRARNKRPSSSMDSFEDCSKKDR